MTVYNNGFLTLTKNFVYVRFLIVLYYCSAPEGDPEFIKVNILHSMTENKRYPTYCVLNSDLPLYYLYYNLQPYFHWFRDEFRRILSQQVLVNRE